GGRTGFQSAPGQKTGGNQECRSPDFGLLGFNPPPVTRPGETTSAGIRCGWDSSFNPPPVTRPGETTWSACAGPPRSSFNPPPVTKRGDTDKGDGRAREGRGSISPTAQDRENPT